MRAFQVGDIVRAFECQWKIHRIDPYNPLYPNYTLKGTGPIETWAVAFVSDLELIVGEANGRI